MDMTVVFINIILLGAMLGMMGPVLVWQRMSFIGDTMAHSSILGIAIALILHQSTPIGIFAICLIVGLIVYFIKERFPHLLDGGLNVISCSFLGIGLLLAEKNLNRHEELENYLFGDVLQLTFQDTFGIALAAFISVLFIGFYYRSIILVSMDEDFARSMGLNVGRIQFVQMVVVSLVIAVSLKTVGVLIMPAAMIIPAIAAQMFGRSPSKMVYLSILIAVLNLALGIILSLHYRFPTGPSIVVAGTTQFLILLLLKYIWVKKRDSLIKEKSF